MDDYFIYFPRQTKPSRFDAVATAAGYTRIAPNATYPPQRHPLDHHFTWSEGRILHAFQIVYISDGGGWFQSGSPAAKRHRIDPGTVFLLFPNVWHRYAPDAGTGWTEHWIECIGPAITESRRRKRIDPLKPVLRVGRNRELLDAFDLCHRWAGRSQPIRAPIMATLALHILTVVEGAEEAFRVPSPREALALRAQRFISDHFQQKLSVNELADRLKVGSSNLRQCFKQCTGMSIKQFQLQIRLQRAQDLLANTDMSIKEVADVLGFDSAYHLSSQFKQRIGVAPKIWRIRMRGTA